MVLRLAPLRDVWLSSKFLPFEINHGLCYVSDTWKTRIRRKLGIQFTTNYPDLETPETISLSNVIEEINRLLTKTSRSSTLLMT